MREHFRWEVTVNESETEVGGCHTPGKSDKVKRFGSDLLKVAKREITDLKILANPFTRDMY